MAGAVEVRVFQVLCPIGIAPEAPAVFDISMPTRVVDSIRIRIPPGPSGVMGFRLGSAGQQIVPIEADTWIIASDEIINWELPNQIDSGAWQATMYNTGDYDHTIYITMVVHLPDLPKTSAVTAPLFIPAPVVTPAPVPAFVAPAAPVLALSGAS